MDTHYKDASPSDTIQRIRAILHKHGILAMEFAWHRNGNHYQSLTLKVSGTPFSVNGKGVTPELALASAYGELMERLQNLAPFRLIHNFPKEVWTTHGFVYAPDEIRLTAAELLVNRGPWLVRQLLTLPEGVNDLKAIQDWKKVSRVDQAEPFRCVPFYHVNTGGIDYLPMEMVSKMYTSNGMAAGNTMEEALVQGLSEVFERYAIIRILNEPITPPEIERDRIMANPVLSGLVNDVESTGKYRLCFKDCSLGIGLPVVAVICTELDTGRYFVKFGAQPLFEIAVERTLTELLQGQELQAMKGFQTFSYPSPTGDSVQNLMGILVNGCGQYPLSFFQEDGSYECSSLWSERVSNRQLLDRMLDFVKSNGWDLFIRDVSFLGFPACQIIIPGVSEVERFDSSGSIESYNSYIHICEQLRRVPSLDDRQREALADEIAMHSKGDASPVDWMHLDVANPPWVYRNTDWLLVALYASAGNAGKAARCWQSFLDSYSRTSRESDAPLYFRCAANYFSLLAGGIAASQAERTLSLFYPQSMVERVINEFSRDSLLYGLSWLPCFNCDACPSKGLCSHRELEKLYLSLKQAYRNNVIDQSRLASLLAITSNSFPM